MYINMQIGGFYFEVNANRLNYHLELTVGIKRNKFYNYLRNLTVELYLLIIFHLLLW